MSTSASTARAAGGRLVLALLLGGAIDAVAAPGAPSPDFAGTLSMTGAVVEGTVSAISHAYSAEAGPRTRITLESVRAHVGRAPEKVVLDTYGGPLPDGTYAAMAGEPQFVPGKRYLVFLTNRPWRYSPVVRQLAFRIEEVGGRKILVADNGRPARTVAADGIALGGTPLFEATAPGDRRPPKARQIVAATAGSVPSLAEFIVSLRGTFPKADTGDRQPRLLPERPLRTAAAAQGPDAAGTADVDPTIPARLRQGR